jgi:hypothetical protein
MQKPRFNPFPRVGGVYGAPMGRADSATPADFEGLTLADLCISHPQGEYDSGGAYWGLTPRYQHGADNSETGPVYAVWARGKGRALGIMYVRAWSAANAKIKALGLYDIKGA